MACRHVPSNSKYGVKVVISVSLLAIAPWDLRFHLVVGADAAFSTPSSEIFRRRQNRHRWRRENDNRRAGGGTLAGIPWASAESKAAYRTRVPETAKDHSHNLNPS